MGNGTGGSRSLAVGGTSILRATLKVQEHARAIAAHVLEAAKDDVVFDDGRYQVKGVPARALTLSQIAGHAYGDKLPDGIESGLEATDFFRPPQLLYPFGAHVAVVEVDRETGQVTVREFVSVDDCGVRISPMLVTGQVHGGLAQGIAQALFEEMVYGADGQLVTGSLMDYCVPRAEDLPSFVTDRDRHADAGEPAGRQGHRRGGDDRLDAGSRQRRGRRAPARSTFGTSTCRSARSACGTPCTPAGPEGA